MDPLTKKEREARAVCALQDLYEPFPPGVLVSGEEPDFVVSGPSRRLGIEVVSFVRGQGPEGSRIRRLEQMQQWIIEAAQVDFERSSTARIQVHVHWYHHRDVHKRDVRAVAAEVAVVVAKHVPEQLGESSTVALEFSDDWPLAANHIPRISIRRLRGVGQSSWSCVEVGPAEVSHDEIQAIIDVKNTKLGAYLTRCDVAWLLIVADGSHVSSWGDLPSSTVRHVFVGGFERVLFLDMASRSLTEFSIVPS